MAQDFYWLRHVCLPRTLVLEKEKELVKVGVTFGNIVRLSFPNIGNDISGGL